MIENNIQNSNSASEQDKEINDHNGGTSDMFFHKNQIEDIRSTQQSFQRKKSVNKVLQSLGFQIFITILALFSLFSDDIRMAAFVGTADLAFDIIHIILMIIFLVQILLSCYALPGYVLSFYFFLDLISSFSLLFDVSMLTELMYKNNTSSYNLNQLAAQSRASRVATRAVRIVKLVRIIRIVKMYKAGSQAAQIKQEQKRLKLEQTLKKQQAKSEYGNERSEKSYKKSLKKIEQQAKNKLEMTDFQLIQKKNIDSLNENEQKKDKQDDFEINGQLIQKIDEKQSKISKVLSDLTVKKVIIVVLLIMFLVPLFDTDNYVSNAQNWDHTTKNIHQLLLNPMVQFHTINQFTLQTLQDRSKHNSQNFIAYFATPFNELPFLEDQEYSDQRFLDLTISIQIIDVKQIMKIRPELTLRSNTPQIQQSNIYAAVNYHSNNQLDAIFSISKTLFICIVLMGMLHFFTQDINQLIVKPIQDMMENVMQIAKNPQSSQNKVNINNQYETAIVHNAIVKIGALLSLVFGSAGAQIIGSNIMKQGDVNPMIGGKKKCAIFGFCDIRNFTEITEVLQEDIMLFVNKIGELVHSSVYRYGGSANKNIGEAFLLVWQLPDHSYKINNKTNQITWKDYDHVNLACDFAVYSFVKAIVKINKQPAILEFRNDQRLKGAFNGSYQLKMGFGIHIGWAIEGAIGSQYKIDASYLSPNVNMASRLQAATRQYGVNLLISQNLFELLTPEMKQYCRQIDRVTVKGSAKPIKLYTIDLNLDSITPPANKNMKYKKSDVPPTDVQTKRQVNMGYFCKNKRSRYNADDFIMRKKELRQVMVGAMSAQFYKRYNQGLQCYLQGRWSDSKLHLNEALKMGKNDGPARNLLNYMKTYDFQAPQSWSNYRPLTSK